MKKTQPLILAVLFSCSLFAQPPHINTNKEAVINSVDKHFDVMRTLSDRIWSYEEIAFQEIRSSKDLQEYARSNGFEVTTNIGDIPTAFTAEFGSGSPVIGILGEFDALPGLSTKNSAVQRAFE